ncbi:MAG: hypothetical protein AB2L07_09295 [Thermoanaerobaculaceae bacterium]
MSDVPSRPSPDPSIADRIIRTYHAGSRPQGARVRLPGAHSLRDSHELLQETIAGTFVEVFLAREGHDRPVGMNLLTKIQLPTLAALYGAMLAGVDVVIMGAGIPREVPAILDALATHRDVSMAVHVEGGHGETTTSASSPEPRDALVANLPPELRRPLFFPIVSSNLLATTMVRKSSGRGRRAGHRGPPPQVATTRHPGVNARWTRTENRYTDPRTR